MKKRLIAGLVALGILIASVIPTGVSADSCCDYEGDSCCWRMCCAEQTNDYRVSYLKKVPTGYFFRGMECVAGVWTTEIVEAHNAEEAAEMLGFRAGYDCFVGRV